ncbi:NUDIX hydrolase [Amycolatopsis echigonensis]|uniref:ADP-ribose pyrophosphatase YjhB (NUDIX family) n=1 Tax=Amycolatopsis echigonensis TaxID=2576905 RepID=A0A2N3WMV3_9PSEU|nr:MULTISPECIES: NUDIX domain-containing protein [Amycolatopsis]MBB2502288.1 NUDIX domain-containing protein [Amycolatopsis echigonensis]PKV95202.1 ADP-ribose pyrophosphatase YjhB (NUDIX family) [Amycolatopsis niigatensis]
MNYIAELRALVGTRPLILPGTSVLIADERGRLLLVFREESQDWGLPGGFLDPGESYEDAGRREVREEIGLVVRDLELLGVYSGPEYFYRYPHGDEVHNVTAAFAATVENTDVTVDGTEITGYEFFDLDRLPDDIIAPERPIVEDYVKRFGG